MLTVCSAHTACHANNTNAKDPAPKSKASRRAPMLADMPKPASAKKVGTWMHMKRAWPKAPHDSSGSSGMRLPGPGDCTPTWLKTTWQARKKRTPSVAREILGGPFLDVAWVSMVAGSMPIFSASPARIGLFVFVLGRSSHVITAATDGHLLGARPLARHAPRISLSSTY